MKPKPDQDVARSNAVSPVFSGGRPVSALSAKTEEERDLFDIEDADIKAVEAVVDQDPFPEGDPEA
jgi:hypothetical protein